MVQLSGRVRLNRESIEDAIKEQVDIPSWIRPISLGNRKIDSMCEKMNPELESGLKEQMTQKREAFEELIVGQELRTCSPSEEAIILIQ